MDDFRPEVAYSGIGGSGFGATVVEEASESKESDFLRISLRASSSRRGASLTIFSCRSFKIFSFLAQTCHFPKSLSISKCFILAFLAKNALGLTTLGHAPRALPGRVGGLGR